MTDELSKRPRPRRWPRRLMWTLLVMIAGYLLTLLGGMPVAWPFDLPANLGFTPERAELRLPADGKRRVAVLQHGLLRSSYSLGRLARTLRDHGYEVHNLDYPSTRGTIEDHADLLAAELVPVAAAGGAIAEWVFVGHSMGGLVIEEYLRRPGAPIPSACVYIATPHRGAMLAELRQDWFLFRWVMGQQAALQLSPGDEFHRRPIPFAERSAAIVGDVGAGNGSIPGDDDGTVGVAEARLEGAAATLVLPFGHTLIAIHPETAAQVLAFVRTGRFAPE